MEITYGNSGIKKYISTCLGKREYPGKEDGNYVFGMLLENDIPYIIRPVMVSVDGRMTLTYDTENDYILGSLLCRLKPDGALLDMLLRQINDCVKELEAYLLNGDDLVLDPGFMLYRYEEKSLRLLYVPGYGRSLRKQLQHFLEFLMLHFDARDTEGMKSLYGNYELLKGNVPAVYSLPVMKPQINASEKGSHQAMLELLPNSTEESTVPAQKAVSLMPLKNGALKKMTISEEDKPYVIGRHKKDTNYSIRTLQISRKHAVLMLHEGKLTVMDCESANGTYVNGRILVPDEPVKLEPGDVVSFAGEEFYVE